MPSNAHKKGFQTKLNADRAINHSMLLAYICNTRHKVKSPEKVLKNRMKYAVEISHERLTSCSQGIYEFLQLPNDFLNARLRDKVLMIPGDDNVQRRDSIKKFFNFPGHHI